MRKRLLRSRSGFEKPESREEAIMQNILGASNVLEPSESNIEEILKSILYNTPYTKEAEFEIEKILLAIKNNGTYDGEGESRDMKILIAILNDLDYTEEAESRIEELFIEWLHQRSSIKVLEGVPPLTFTARGLPLINYLIEGNTVQNGTPTPQNPIQPQECGERTENLFDYSAVTTGYRIIWTTGELYADSTSILSDFIEVSEGETYKVSDTVIEAFTAYIIGYNSNKEYLGVYHPTDGFRKSASSRYSSINIPTGYDCKYIKLMTYTSNDLGNTSMFTEGYSLPSTFIPYGYKIQISSASTTTPVYLGAVQSTRRIKKLVFDGTENWTDYGNSIYRLRISTYGSGVTAQAVSSHYIGINSISNMPDKSFLSGENFLYFRDTDYTTADAFITYLAQQYTNGTPVCVWYALATPTTGIVNEPIRKIGDYADTLSMEQAGVQIPTNNGTTVIDVNTTVRPSNVYIEYK